MSDLLDDVARLQEAVGRLERERIARLPAPLSALPPEPYSGQEVLYLASVIPWVEWRLVYRAEAPAPYRWIALGPTELRAERPEPNLVISWTAYQDHATSPGPAITVPLAGDYYVEWGAQAHHVATGGIGFVAVKNGAAATSDLDSIRGQSWTATADVAVPIGSKGFSVAAAGTVLKVQYRSGGGGNLVVNTAGVIVPWITARPVRVG